MNVAAGLLRRLRSALGVRFPDWAAPDGAWHRCDGNWVGGFPVAATWADGAYDEARAGLEALRP